MRQVVVPLVLFRDRCPFAGEIDIWDNMSIVARYARGATLSYQLHAYSPYEGYRIAFNGTRGRLEHFACEATYVSGDGSVPGELAPENVSITLIPPPHVLGSAWEKGLAA